MLPWKNNTNSLTKKKTKIGITENLPACALYEWSVKRKAPFTTDHSPLTQLHFFGLGHLCIVFYASQKQRKIVRQPFITADVNVKPVLQAADYFVNVVTQKEKATLVVV